MKINRNKFKTLLKLSWSNVFIGSLCIILKSQNKKQNIYFNVNKQLLDKT